MPMPGNPQNTSTRHTRKFRRARIRNLLFTVGPNRLSGGRIVRRHLAQGVEVREIEVEIQNWPRAFDGLRIGHISDFHLGELLPLDRAIEIVQMLGDQQPDLVACTGDVVDLHNDGAQPLLNELAAIDAPLGSLLVMGNHDHLDSATELTERAEAAGLGVLRDEAVAYARNGQRLVVAGIDWGRTAVECTRRVKRTCGTETHLLLAHNPKAFLSASRLSIPLTLTGHTHGGQVAIKGRSDANLAVSHRRSAGLYEHRSSQLYVTTGVGAWFPLRVNCPAEIAILTVRKQQ